MYPFTRPTDWWLTKIYSSFHFSKTINASICWLEVNGQWFSRGWIKQDYGAQVIDNNQHRLNQTWWYGDILFRLTIPSSSMKESIKIQCCEHARNWITLCLTEFITYIYIYGKQVNLVPPKMIDHKTASFQSECFRYTVIQQKPSINA